MTSTGEWRLGRRPALDGLRTCAVALVFATHLGVPGVQGAGAVGVGVFFTLSGFLITNILLTERERTGRVRLGAFYQRRARRLMPAMLALVAFVVTIGALGPLRLNWAAVAGTLTYTANFVRMGAVDGDHMLGHTWSLAIEEQFYLLWPLAFLLVARWSKRSALLALATACAGCLLLRVSLWDGTEATAVRIYDGLDTRADSLLIGCMLALFMHGRREARPAAGWAAAGGALILLSTQGSAWGTLVVGPLVVSVAACAVIYGAATGGARWLTWSPLVYVGRRSYGLYLFHLPAFALGALWVGDSWTAKLLAWVPLALGLMLLSWRYVERPTRSVQVEAEPSERHPTVRRRASRLDIAGSRHDHLAEQVS